MIKQQGYINGLVYDANAKADARPRADLLQAADMIRVGLAGTVRNYAFVNADGMTRKLEDMQYGGQPAGYASAPGETVNYVENHDNQTLYDANALKLPLATSTADRARVQVLGLAINAFSQGVAYFHAGSDILRSKSLDRNSFNSGDWFNRIDWTYQHQLLRHRPAARAGQRQGLAAVPAAAGECRAAPAAGGHRLCPRRLPRPAGDPRQLDPVPAAHGRRGGAPPALLQRRPAAGADGDRRPPRWTRLCRRRFHGHPLLHQRRQGGARRA